MGYFMYTNLFYEMLHEYIRMEGVYMKKITIWTSVIAGFLVFSIALGFCSDRTGIRKIAGVAVSEEEKGDLCIPPESGKKSTVTLNFTYWGNFNEKRVIENVCNKFTKKYPHIIAEAVQIEGNYAAQMQLMASSGNLPDIGYMPVDLGEKWAAEGKFVNLFDMLARDGEIKREDFLDYIWYKQSSGDAWGISSAGECFGLYYNKVLLREACIDSLPSAAEDAMAWEEFVDTARRLTLDTSGRNACDKNFDPEHIKQYGIMFDTNYSPSLNNFIFSNGGEWISKDGKNFNLNGPEGVEAIQKLADLINVHHVAPSPAEARALPGLTDAFEAGVAAMMVGGQWINTDLSSGKVSYDIGVLPRMEKSLTVGMSGATVLFGSSEHLEEAWLLLKMMSDPEACIEPYSSGLWMPLKKEWYTNPRLIEKWVDVNPAAHPQGFKDAMMRQLINHGVPDASFYMKNQSRIIPPVMEALRPVWNGSKTAYDALKEVADKVQPAIKGRYDVE